MKRKNQFRENSQKLLNNPNELKITRINRGETLFELGEVLTSDLGEAIAIMMSTEIKDSSIWKTKVTEDLDKVEPRRALYWLSGGDVEWLTLENYNKNWTECEWSFQEKFGLTLMEIIKKSETYGDIRRGFIKKLNLSTLYEFALSKNLVR